MFGLEFNHLISIVPFFSFTWAFTSYLFLILNTLFLMSITSFILLRIFKILSHSKIALIIPLDFESVYLMVGCVYFLSNGLPHVCRLRLSLPFPSGFKVGHPSSRAHNLQAWSSCDGGEITVPNSQPPGNSDTSGPQLFKATAESRGFQPSFHPAQPSSQSYPGYLTLVPPYRVIFTSPDSESNCLFPFCVSLCGCFLFLSTPISSCFLLLFICNCCIWSRVRNQQQDKQYHKNTT